MKAKKTISTTSRVETRIPSELKSLFMQAAKMQGSSLTNFLISSAKKEAEAIFRQQTLITLTLQDALLFTAQCLSDSEPNAKLKSAVKKFDKLNSL